MVTQCVRGQVSRPRHAIMLPAFEDMRPTRHPWRQLYLAFNRCQQCGAGERASQVARFLSNIPHQP
jgi:hypothetical protein